MHRILTTAILAMAAFSVYAQDWKAIDAYAGKGMPREALAASETAFAEASARRDYPAMTRSMEYIFRFETEIDRSRSRSVYDRFAAADTLFSADPGGRLCYESLMIRLAIGHPAGRDLPKEIPARIRKVSRSAAELDTAAYVSFLFDCCRNGADRYAGEWFYDSLDRATAHSSDLQTISRMYRINSQYAPYPKARLRLLTELLDESPASPGLAEVALERLRLQLIFLESRDGEQSAAATAAFLEECRLWQRRTEDSGIRKSLADLEASLLAPCLEASVNRLNAPGQAVPLFLEYRNLDRLTLDVYREDQRILRRRIRVENRPGRWNTDTLSIPISAPGRYRIRISSGKLSRTLETGATSIGAVSRNRSGLSTEIYAADLQTGKPVSRASVRYRLEQNRETAELSGQLTLEGFTPVPIPDSVRSARPGALSFRIGIPGSDDVFPDDFLLTEIPQDTARTERRIRILTDRALYRPGDTLHFKAIVYEELHGRQQTLAGETVSLLLTGPSGAPSDSIRIRTNRFGSAAGFLILPAKGLNGVYFLHAAGTYTQGGLIRMEEASDPRMEVELTANPVPLFFGDTLRQTGILRNHTGMPVAGATVRYRIRRDGILRESGEAVTGTDGTFSVPVPLTRPMSDDDTHIATGFSLEVSATDAAGDTRTRTGTYLVSDRPVQIRADFPELMRKEGYHTEPPCIRTLLPDLTPYDCPGTLHLLRNGQAIVDLPFTGNTPLPFDWTLLPSGAYRGYVTVSCGNAEVRDSLAFTLLSERDTRMPDERDLLFLPLPESADSDRIAFLAGTSRDTLYAELELFDGEERLYRQALRLPQGIVRIELPYLETYPDAVTLSLLTVTGGKSIHRTAVYRRNSPGQTVSVRTVEWNRNALPGSLQRIRWEITAAPGTCGEWAVSLFDIRTDRFGANSFSLPGSAAQPRPAPYIRALYSGPVRPVRLSAAFRSADNRAVADEAVAEAAAKQAGNPDQAEIQPDFLRDDSRKTLLFLPDIPFACGPDGRAIIDAEYETGGLTGTFRCLGLAHTTSLACAASADTVVIDRPVSVSSRLPEFLRAGDTLRYACSVRNGTGKAVQGTARLILTHPQSGKILEIRSTEGRVEAGETAVFSWPVPTPDAVSSLQATLSFESPDGSDGEIRRLPVLERNTPFLRAETRILERPGETVLPLPQATAGTDTADTFLEINAPLLTVLDALPMLAYPVSDNLVEWINAWYARSLNNRLMLRHPEIASWTAARLSDSLSSGTLERNAALADILLSETPWNTGRNGRHLNKNELAGWLDSARREAGIREALERIGRFQRADGGMEWFPGMGSSYTVTLLFLDRAASLDEAGLIPESGEPWRTILSDAVRYCDSTFRETLRQTEDAGQPFPVQAVLEYLYVRTRLTAGGIPATDTRELARWEGLIRRNWVNYPIPDKARLASILLHSGQRDIAADILYSLQQYIVRNETLGCYFPNAADGAYRFSNPSLQVHALLVRLLRQTGDTETASEVSKWLMLQKNNRMWSDRTAVADVVRTLAEQDFPLPDYEISAPDGSLIPTDGTVSRTAFRLLAADREHPGRIRIRTRNGSPLFITVYTRTRDTSAAPAPEGHGIRMTDECFRILGNREIPVRNGDTLVPGTEIVCRRRIVSDEALDFVSLRFSRSGCLLPADETSGYGWFGCPAYRENRANQTRYYLQTLPRGETVWEERFYVTREGVFRNGETEVRSLYAPERYLRQRSFPERLVVDFQTDASVPEGRF